MNNPKPPATALGERVLAHLRAVVAVDSQSDEASDTIPTTAGQSHLSDEIARFFVRLGAKVERDDQANMLASVPGRGRGRGQAPLALMVHLDTARGSQATSDLSLLPAWDGSSVPYPRNQSLKVDVETYPTARSFLGQTLVYGPGEAPFGLDDKLGLAQMMALAELLVSDPSIEHPPLLFVARPDEEVGRMEAVESLSQRLADLGVRFGYTIDGILPFEINGENFNGAHGSVTFTGRPLSLPPGWGEAVRVELGGVNTHGATAKAEGSRSAVRLAMEIRDLLPAGVARPFRFQSDELRDCDAEMDWVVGPGGRDALADAMEQVVGPHINRGASCSMLSIPRPAQVSDAAEQMLSFVKDFLETEGPRPLLAEDSEGRQGYSAPYRAVEDGQNLRLDVRIRDFTEAGLKARMDHLMALARRWGLAASVHHQYRNMGPRLAERPELLQWPAEAGRQLRLEVVEAPIRGGTGVDPFLDRGIYVANLGTGYFAPESEKEFTSLELMERHTRWLAAIVEKVAISQA